MKLSLSKVSILIILVTWISVFINTRAWEKTPIVADVVSYYGYLPAAFIYNDIHLEFVDKDPEFFYGKYWPEVAPNGGRTIKTTMGLAVLYSPFFLIGHLTAKLLDYGQTGFSTPYQVALIFSCFFYLLLGLLYLRKFLLKYFSEPVTCITIISLYFGTHLLYYSIIEGLLAHVYLFSLLSVMVYLTVKWHEKPRLPISALLGSIIGLTVLIRPTMLIFLLFPLFYNIYDKHSLLEKIKMFKREKLNILIAVFTFILVGLPQLIYWKSVTGHWLYYSYTGERFFWDNPHLLEGFFSYRKGWLLYTPIMVFSIIGLFLLRKYLKSAFLSVTIPFLISVYVILCWWAWWYGGSFGQRAFIDFYGVLALPMACFYRSALEKGPGKILTLFFAFSLIGLSLFQNWQYTKGLIHFDSMTKETYWMNFGRTKWAEDWWEKLERPEYERAKKGLPDEVKGTGIVEIIDFEKVYSSYDLLGISETHSLSGKRSFKLNNHTPVSSQISINLFRLPDKDLELYASVNLYLKDTIQEKTCWLVISFESEKGKLEKQVAYFEPGNTKLNQWNTLNLSCKLPVWETKSDMLRVYVESRGRSEILIDDLILELRNVR